METSKKWSQSILLPRGSFLFKENTKAQAESTLDLTKEKKKKKGQHSEDEDDKFEKIRADKEHKRNYLSTISARFNPDVLIGGETQFIRGNEYHTRNKKKSKSKKEKDAQVSDEEDDSQ